MAEKVTTGNLKSLQDLSIHSDDLNDCMTAHWGHLHKLRLAGYLAETETTVQQYRTNMPALSSVVILRYFNKLPLEDVEVLNEMREAGLVVVQAEPN